MSRLYEVEEADPTAELAPVDPVVAPVLEQAAEQIRTMETSAARLTDAIRAQQIELVRLRFRQGRIVHAVLETAAITHAVKRLSEATGLSEPTLYLCRNWFRYWSGVEADMELWLAATDHTTWTQAIRLLRPLSSSRQQLATEPDSPRRLLAEPPKERTNDEGPPPADAPRTDAPPAPRAAARREDPISYRVYLEFTGAEADLVRSVLGGSPRKRLLEICRTLTGAHQGPPAATASPA
jgi:hypothetical protein